MECGESKQRSEEVSERNVMKHCYGNSLVWEHIQAVITAVKKIEHQRC